MKNLKFTDVRAVPGDASFLIDNGKTTVLYDTGFAFTGYEVANRIKKVLGDRPLDYIFLTHSHYDHALGSVYIKKLYPNAKIVASTYASKIFDKPSARKVMRELDKKFAVKCGIDEYEDLIDELSADVIVEDGDVINAGDMSFKVVALPGHTKCSVAFYCESKKLLLGSETIGVFNGDNDVIPSYLVGYQLTLDSISKASKLEIDNILVPHYGVLSTEQTKLYLKQAVTSAKSTAEDIVRMLKDGKTKDDCIKYFKDRFYHGYTKTIYPQDAINLNTSIMIDLLIKEFNL